jgi:small subunit ribosomal protein S18
MIKMDRKNKDPKRMPRKSIKFQKDCAFCKNSLDLDYKNIELLSRHVNSRGRITSRRVSGNCAKHQRKIASEVKRARFLNLLPYVGR